MRKEYGHRVVLIRVNAMQAGWPRTVSLMRMPQSQEYIASWLHEKATKGPCSVHLLQDSKTFQRPPGGVAGSGHGLLSRLEAQVVHLVRFDIGPHFSSGRFKCWHLVAGPNQLRGRTVRRHVAFHNSPADPMPVIYIQNVHTVL